MATVPDGTLMQRAATGLAKHCVHQLSEANVAIAGSTVVLLIGSGDNGGDALWAGAILAKQGANVTAIQLADKCHADGERALCLAGGHVEIVDLVRHVAAIDDADLVIDGIVGIGGAGALRSPAAALAAAATASHACVIAVDLPSGIDADTGAVADPTAVITADITVTFGCIKTGLVSMPGSTHVGNLRLVDIGLAEVLPAMPDVFVVDRYDVVRATPMPGPTDDKYTRGVVGVVAGSAAYPGAAVLCSGSARLGGTGMVRYAGSAADHVVAEWPDVVASGGGPAEAGKVQSWVVGPGGGTDHESRNRFVEALQSPAVVVLDADALTVLAKDDEMRGLIRERNARRQPTVLTPHSGEFARLGFELGSGEKEDRIAVLRNAAAEMQAVILLKGSCTLIATPEGTVVANNHSSSALATAGSGDVLAGLIGSMLASATARLTSTEGEATSAALALDNDAVAQLVGASAWLHGEAGTLAAQGGRPVTATDVLDSLSDAIAYARTIDV